MFYWLDMLRDEEKRKLMAGQSFLKELLLSLGIASVYLVLFGLLWKLVFG